ncbi:hypothetical protein KCH_08600 [Kitasatospora cheerisanensis KCTC 2395]|uniref:Uncharacterized protein n=1 Tax=Kitasatospora cheerisanensis KCTC 2395 TaxID=1348663 RepID=A0A066Z545_9ACTN|nr:hypothetical protein KCH_08600 [Kitasatospora cheerisanensis KCTC 2395]
MQDGHGGQRQCDGGDGVAEPADRRGRPVAPERRGGRGGGHRWSGAGLGGGAGHGAPVGRASAESAEFE